MAIPEHIQWLRERVGHAPLLLPGVVGVVLDDKGRILLNHRTDSDEWALISGIAEFDEQPQETIVREILEETGVTAEVVWLIDAWMGPLVTYKNEDQAQYMTVAYLCRAVAGEPSACDDESHDARFFARNELPPLSDELQRILDLTLDGDA